ncbi:hypothetical protein TcWFU_005125 [Taenia crassiceps]|uniref:Uncharacterized protein n=1 Tax=Taenia crassiceps TaxID=6207 RepID=A0ABR4QR91_9CEST
MQTVRQRVENRERTLGFCHPREGVGTSANAAPRGVITGKANSTGVRHVRTRMTLPSPAGPSSAITRLLTNRLEGGEVITITACKLVHPGRPEGQTLGKIQENEKWNPGWRLKRRRRWNRRLVGKAPFADAPNAASGGIVNPNTWDSRLGDVPLWLGLLSLGHFEDV